jgi:hypothetical protein
VHTGQSEGLEELGLLFNLGPAVFFVILETSLSISWTRQSPQHHRALLFAISPPFIVVIWAASVTPPGWSRWPTKGQLRTELVLEDLISKCASASALTR